MELHTTVHDEIGIKNCTDSAETYDKCKQIFRLHFSRELIEKYANVVGLKNEDGEDYWRGEAVYKRVTGEDFFYTS